MSVYTKNIYLALSYSVKYSLCVQYCIFPFASYTVLCCTVLHIIRQSGSLFYDLTAQLPDTSHPIKSEAAKHSPDPTAGFAHVPTLTADLLFPSRPGNPERYTARVTIYGIQ